MPIFNDPDLRLAGAKGDPGPALGEGSPPARMRRPSEDSIRTEFCDGPEPEMPTWIATLEDKAAAMANKETGTRTSDRAELIERIKRGESPTWVPNQALEEEIYKTEPRTILSLPSSSSENNTSGHLLPSPQVIDQKQIAHRSPQGPLSPPAEIQRPRSALHSGNFTDGIDRAKEQPLNAPRDVDESIIGPREDTLGTSPATPWYASSTTWRRADLESSFQDNERYPEWADRRSVRSRAPSLQSYSSSYILKAPTTPLVQQSNSEDLDPSSSSPAGSSGNSNKGNRRHKLPPNALSSALAIPPDTPQQYTSPPSARRVASMPYQAHRPRRSLTSTLSLRSVDPPGTSGASRLRRSSHSSEAASIQRASMVGSYEESILRGWMSTAPSKPLDFTAQIGVLGKNGCKPKCPAHVTLAFPAVFYSYGTGTGRRQGIMDEPSPYVGQIDLHQLSPPIETEGNRHKRRRSPAIFHSDEGHISSGNENENENENENGNGNGNLRTRKRKKRRRTPSPSKLPPAGCYRIPEQGQLQIVIKNPNKTAVKLFLVPYDLTGMEAGTKTFIRQRCYSAGPAIDYALTSKIEGSRAIQVGMETDRKPTLRYLIHVNICSPSKGRFYLYQHMRVVFANRVPDNKEQLQNEIQLPQPRFSAYRPNIEVSTPSSDTVSKLTAEKAYRRRSSGFGDQYENRDPRSMQSLGDTLHYPYACTSPPPPVPAIPFGLAMSGTKPHEENPYGSDGTSDYQPRRPTTATSDVQSPLSDKVSRLVRNFSGSFKSNSSNSSDSYTKLNKGDNGYGGLFGRASTPEPGEGLLARRLKGLGLQRGERPEQHDEI